MIAIARPPKTPQGTLVSPIVENDVSPMDPNARARTVGPFAIVAHFDSTFGPGEAPRDLDVRPHPHIGIATLTYLFDGLITHRDGEGGFGEIGPGDIGWMITGRGIVHSERLPTFRERGGRLHGLQIWVALSEGEADCMPSFEHVRAADVRVSESAGTRIHHLLGGESAIRVSENAFGPIWICDVELEAGATYTAPSGSEGAFYVIEGSVQLDGHQLDAGTLATFHADDARRFVASAKARAICFGGDPIGPRYLWWNYLHPRKERIDEAKLAWTEKKFALPSADQDEFIPLPADHERPLRVLNAP